MINDIFYPHLLKSAIILQEYTVHSDKRKQTGEYKKVSSKPSNSDSKFYRAYNFESLLRSFVFCRLFQFKSFSCPLSLLVLLVLKSCTCELS